MIINLRKIKFIPKTNSPRTIQNNCKVPLRKILNTLKEKYGGDIVSFYLYGSFSYGKGILKKSDLDLFIVTKKKINFRKEEIRLAPFYKRYFSELNLFSKTKKEILSNKDGWCTFMSLFCVFINGEEIISKESRYKVDERLIRDLLEDREILSLQFRKGDPLIRMKKISKILIINMYYATLDKHLLWTTSFDEQVKVLKKTYPDLGGKIDILYQVVNGKKYSYLKINEICKTLRKIPLGRK